MSLIISIDCGTTSTRAIAFDEFQAPVHVEQLQLPIHHPQYDWVEQSPYDIWNLTHQCLLNMLTKLSGQTIHSIGITNQRETAIIWNKLTGEAIGPAISWQCRRTATICNDLKASEHMIKDKTGLTLDPYFSASKFKWLLHQHPDTSELLAKGHLYFGTVDTWLLWNLTNGRSYATDVTNASRTMLFNIETLAYDSELCDLFNIPIDALPSVYPSAYNYGSYQFNTFDIPIHSIIGDQQSALYAQCGSTLGRIKSTYGTGLFVMANTGHSIVHTKQLITTIAIGLDSNIQYAIEGSIFSGGSLIQWLRDQLGLLKSTKDSEEIASMVDSSSGVYIIPALSGLGAPHWNSNVTGLITGLTAHINKSHIIRAALESLAFQINDILELIYTESPDIPFTEILVDGGASDNDLLMQFQSDISNLDILRPPFVEATALGAAKCAAFYTSHWDNQILSNQLHTSFTPTMSELTRVNLLSGWNKALNLCIS